MFLKTTSYLKACVLHRTGTFGQSRGRKGLHDAVLRIHPCVQEALGDGKPVVALESTIVTHGMPYPHNIRMAREVEEIVRRNGSVPATVGVLHGRVHVGLDDTELQFLAEAKDAVKVSRRDLPYVLSQRLSGGTTVSGTIIAAHKAGINIFVTGGIGGVHRGAETSMDVSADLTELGRSPVAVVSAGVKSILDIGRTLEYLETQGVCVASFGGSREFPAFFSPNSGFQAPFMVKDDKEAALLIASALELGLGSGILIAVPIPAEAAASGQEVEEAVQRALREAREQEIRGKEVTPFVLQRVNELTGGKSLEANLALVRNNAEVGSLIAGSLSKLRSVGQSGRDARTRRKRSAGPERGGEGTSPPTKSRIPLKSRPVVIGGTNVDFIAKATNENLLLGGQTNPGRVYQTFGGVGRNLADALSRLGTDPLFISAVGSDRLSESVLRYCSHMDLRGVSRLQDHSTATYCAFISDRGELSLGLGDFDIHQQITEHSLSGFEEHIRSAALLCIDGNVPVSAIQYACRIAKQCQVPVCYEPTDEGKASKPFLSGAWKALTYISPNLLELGAINRSLGRAAPRDLPTSLDGILEAAVTLSRPLLEHLHCVVVTLGAHGVLLCGRSSEGQTVSLRPGFREQEPRGDLCATHYPAAPIPSEEIMNVSGAGDSLMAGIIAGIVSGWDTDTTVRMGLLCARLSLRSQDPISQHISPARMSLGHVRAEQWPEPQRWQL
ncbi:hypothetical protein NDU88_007022 [Pleurodeles waltl]|uniref:Carbohydrate kinase PfkB domain-containing protein n=1 Tax=Pleurodeles waltl TaxID=8319 RepID=A0AAV7SRC2_PLEWA|nr:hypothetical protein NDU88_007022 [Pleurodeles waltl]